jgi:hypothetical protein
MGIIYPSPHNYMATVVFVSRINKVANIPVDLCPFQAIYCDAESPFETKRYCSGRMVLQGYTKPNPGLGQIGLPY